LTRRSNSTEHVRFHRELSDEEATERLSLRGPVDRAQCSLRFRVAILDKRLSRDALDAAS
jgi:hypothetical protein